MGASEIVSVSVSLTNVNPSGTSFNVGLIAAYHTQYADRVRTYSNLPAVAVDFPSTTLNTPAGTVYLMAQKYFSDSPAPATLKVGRRALPTLSKATINVLDSVTDLCSITIMGVKVSATTSTTTALSATAIYNAIVSATVTGLSSTVTASAITLTSSVTGTVLRLAGWSRAQLDVENSSADPGIATDMAAILAADPNFYGVALDSQGDAEITAAAAWAESTALKELFFDSSDGSIASSTTTDLLSTLKASSYKHTIPLFNGVDTQQYSGVSLMAESMLSNPGSYTLDLRNLPGITPDLLTDTEATNIQGKNGNVYRTIANLNVVTKGTNCKGSFEDSYRFIDWVTQTIQLRLIALFAAASAAKRKIPFTDKGIRVVANTINSVLVDGVRNGGFSDDPALIPQVIVPTFASLASDVADLSIRNLPNVSFTGQLAGAIHSTSVVGTVGGA